MVRTHQRGQAVFRSVLPEDSDPRETALQVVAQNSSRAERHPARLSGSLLPTGMETTLRALEDAANTEGNPATALRNTVEAIWKIVTQAVSEPALEPSRHTVRALLARRELVQRGTCILSAVIRRGVDSGAFRPSCVPWAIERLPFAIVQGACVHWVFGLSKRPSVRAGTAVAAALEILRAKHPTASPPSHDAADRRGRSEHTTSRAKP